jgi:hypothetical protein
MSTYREYAHYKRRLALAWKNVTPETHIGEHDIHPHKAFIHAEPNTKPEDIQAIKNNIDDVDDMSEDPNLKIKSQQVFLDAPHRMEERSEDWDENKPKKLIEGNENRLTNAVSNFGYDENSNHLSLNHLLFFT